jgi:hypothetical protein
MKLVVNGGEVEVDDRHAKTPLLWVLRDVLGLRGVHLDQGTPAAMARDELGWSSTHPELVDEPLHGSYSRQPTG